MRTTIKPVKLNGVTFKTLEGLKRHVDPTTLKKLKVEILEKKTILSKEFKDKILQKKVEFYRSKNSNKDKYFAEVKNYFIVSFRRNSLKNPNSFKPTNFDLSLLDTVNKFYLENLTKLKNNSNQTPGIVFQRRSIKLIIEKELKLINEINSSISRLEILEGEVLKRSEQNKSKNIRNSSDRVYNRLLDSKLKLIEKTINNFTNLKINYEIFKQSI